MKKKLIKWTRPALCACMALAWGIGIGIPCLLIFGEYPYPQDEEM